MIYFFYQVADVKLILPIIIIFASIAIPLLMMTENITNQNGDLVEFMVGQEKSSKQRGLQADIFMFNTKL